jgi:ABC-type maltose transport system permease subunit
MMISSGALNYFSEKSLLYHIENHHFTASVAAVFEHHNRHFRFFIGFYKLIAAFKIRSASNLYARMGSGMAGSVLLMIPPIVIFILMQRNVVETMTFAGMKEG